MLLKLFCKPLKYPMYLKYQLFLMNLKNRLIQMYLKYHLFLNFLMNLSYHLYLKFLKNH